MRLRSFLCGSRGQSIIQYAALLTISALFVSGITVYAQRALKASMKKAQDFAGNQFEGEDPDKEYEPYYILNKSHVESESNNSLELPGGSLLLTSSYSDDSTDFHNVTCAENGDCE